MRFDFQAWVYQIRQEIAQPLPLGLAVCDALRAEVAGLFLLRSVVEATYHLEGKGFLAPIAHSTIAWVGRSLGNALLRPQDSFAAGFLQHAHTSYNVQQALVVYAKLVCFPVGLYFNRKIVPLPG